MIHTNVFSKAYFKTVYEPKSSQERLAVLDTNYHLLKQYCPGGKLLDIACALGEFVHIASKNFDVFGTDISEYAVSIAKKNVPQGNFFVSNAQTDLLPFSNETFDVVSAFDLIEHVSSTDHFFSEVFRVLKPGGIFFITTPAESSFGKFWGRFIPDDPTHINKHNSDYWISELQKSGFRLKLNQGVVAYGFPPSIPIRKLFERISLPVTRKPVFSPLKPLWVTSYLIFEKKII